VKIDTKEEFERAYGRLRRRDCDSLGGFLMSLAMDSGPVGEQIRTFIVGDNVAEAVESVRQRIRGLQTPSDYEHRHSHGREMGKNLDFIVDSVERLVLPIDPKAAFKLLIALFEADGVAVENCGDHDWEVACAYKRAIEVIAEAAKSLLRVEVEDSHALRIGLDRLLFKPYAHYMAVVYEREFVRDKVERGANGRDVRLE
jgi:hypothetical protein